MKRLILAAWLSLLPTLAFAQCNGIFQPNTICGNATASPAVPKQVPNSVLTGIPGGTNGQIQYNNAGAFGGFTPGGDVTFAVPNFTVNTFGTSQSGKVPASGGGTINYLRADGTWNAPGVNTPTVLTGANTTYTSTQCGAIIKRSNAGAAMSDTIPGTGPGVLPINCIIYIANADTAGIISIKAGSGTAIKTALTSTGYAYLCPGQTVAVYSDGTNAWLLGLPNRCKLQGNTTIFITAAGSNSNDGLTASTGFADENAAYQWAQQALDVNLQQLTFSFGTNASPGYPCANINGQLLGTYANQTDGTNVTFLGNAATPANVLIATTTCNNAWRMENGAVGTVNGFTLSNTFGHDFQADEGSIAFIKNLSFIAQGSGQNLMISVGPSYIYVSGNLSLTAYTFNPGAVFLASNGGNIITTQSITMTFSGSFNWLTGFAVTQYFALEVLNGITFSGGTFAGPRCAIGNGSTINTAGGGASYFPGASGCTGTAGAGVYQ